MTKIWNWLGGEMNQANIISWWQGMGQLLILANISVYHYCKQCFLWPATLVIIQNPIKLLMQGVILTDAWPEGGMALLVPGGTTVTSLSCDSFSTQTLPWGLVTPTAHCTHGVALARWGNKIKNERMKVKKKIRNKSNVERRSRKKWKEERRDLSWD